MKILKHFFQQPFITATGAAALIHSTWALGTLFAGEQPEGWALLGWLAPALLISFALDVGQIATSAEIREHGLTRTRGVTFIVFSAATYYLQWLYIAHHMPSLALAAGVRETWAGFATVMRDSAVWIIPALLPLSTLLYTFSGGAVDHPQVTPPVQPPPPEKRPTPIRIASESVQLELLEVQQRPELPSGDVIEISGEWIARYGEWEKAYPNETSARKGLSGRMRYEHSLKKEVSE